MVYLLGLLITAFIAWLQLLPPDAAGSLIRRLDNVIYDQRFNLMPKPVRNYNNKIVVVDIDERSLQAEGHWPWDRFKLARLLEQLERASQDREDARGRGLAATEFMSRLSWPAQIDRLFDAVGDLLPDGPALELDAAGEAILLERCGNDDADLVGGGDG